MEPLVILYCFEIIAGACCKINGISHLAAENDQRKQER